MFYMDDFHIGYTVDPPCRTRVAEPRESLYYAKAEFLFMRVGHGCTVSATKTHAFPKIDLQAYRTLHF